MLRSGQYRALPFRELVPGDIIRLKIGNVVPADVQLLDGDYLLLDQSALTGESLPVDRGMGEALYEVLVADGRGQLSDDDRAYIREMTRRLTRDRLPKPSKRFSVSDRVVCLVGGERGWAAGTVQALDQDGIFPYVVKLDPPDVRLVSVPTDTPEQA